MVRTDQEYFYWVFVRFGGLLLFVYSFYRYFYFDVFMVFESMGTSRWMGCSCKNGCSTLGKGVCWTCFGSRGAKLLFCRSCCSINFISFFGDFRMETVVLFIVLLCLFVNGSGDHVDSFCSIVFVHGYWRISYFFTIDNISGHNSS